MKAPLQMAEKRERFQSSPIGRTPARRPKRQALRQTEGSAVLREPRVLSLRNESTAQPGGPATPTPIAGTQRPSSWSDEESKALLEFLLFHRPSDKWPSTKNQQFWGSAAEFVELRGRGKMRRSGKCYTVLCTHYV